MGTANRFWLHLFTVVSVAVAAAAIRTVSHLDEDDTCVYTVYVRTGSIIKGGTDSIITLTLYDAEGWGVRINNLEAWGGLMGRDYNYFERGNLDIFSGRGPCLTGPVCAMNLTSDGSGSHAGWYCNYVEVTATGPHIPCSQQYFNVEQWLSTEAPPRELTALRNECGAHPFKAQDDHRVREIGGRGDGPVVSAI